MAAVSFTPRAPLGGSCFPLSNSELGPIAGMSQLWGRGRGVPEGLFTRNPKSPLHFPPQPPGTLLPCGISQGVWGWLEDSWEGEGQAGVAGLDLGVVIFVGVVFVGGRGRSGGRAGAGT